MKKGEEPSRVEPLRKNDARLGLRSMPSEKGERGILFVSADKNCQLKGCFLFWQDNSSLAYVVYAWVGLRKCR